MLKKLSSIWKSYKYRFVPWIAFNLNNRSVRRVEKAGEDKIIPGHSLLEQLRALTSALHIVHTQGSSAPQLSLAYQLALEVMEKTYGFHVYRAPSCVGGTGVVVTTYRGCSVAVKQGQLVALYPGALYLPVQPIFIQSINNPFIFRCIDGVLVDGNDKRISKSLFKSCVNRDRVGYFPIADTTWLTDHPTNPLNIGQYVNNQSTGHPSNVAYQELTLEPGDIPLQERQYLPNMWYSPSQGMPVADVPLRTVALVATRDILKGEELFSNYFTVIY
nr:SET domain-containing protein 9-like isoform X2 [Cherax quadricarinatus]XP_053637834.1 SET domain-containing protein 9-like isoform X2 [Cherax quadricarinatus]XP_053637835.1 SET domain-containing protein 9-like isoform X2 [Cherax quadricarinatus]XP_053637836.1 SET domain-containing protein 9-like isoform X2 [Cherax quadricarinatus]XP_053637837.1 SET domain-containing protein 9-like isoform X2 [Cherax quadricarinatus]